MPDAPDPVAGNPLIQARLRFGAKVRHAIRLAMLGNVPGARQMLADATVDLDEIEMLTAKGDGGA